MSSIRTRQALENSLGALARIDPQMKRLWDSAGTPGLRRRKSGFYALARVIVGQQLSIHAAASIWQRLEALCRPFDARTVRATSETRLRQAGLSGAKTKYIRALAAAVEEGAINFKRIHRLADEDAIDALTEIKGIGRWSAECYLLFALGRADVFPAADLALAVSYQNWRRLDERPGEPDFRVIAEAWAPHRSAAARLLWHAYRREVV
ncbi:MAG: DNA-3-methyladenine glycosylase 2 family protein [Alphaproteobacteria bacterium]|nr:DNA-3-methyladenine glycosylase 2 family protein [Alphaproteobacteria bacterium]